jgi:hypothetical protein
VALYRLIALLLPASLVGCGNSQQEWQSKPTPVVEALPQAKAIADVDARSTLALKQDLLTNFPYNSAGSVVETGLRAKGYTCDVNPVANGERACLKVVRESVCETNFIVRTLPYLPDKAQVIKICDLAVQSEPQK